MRQRRMVRWLVGCVCALGMTGASLGAFARTADAQSVPRTFTGTFAGAGTFRNSLCSWRTTYTGTVTLTLTFGASSVTGTARHQGSYQDTLTSGPSECGGDLNAFDETVPVSGTAQGLRWGTRHGAAGSVAVAASLIGNAIVGQGVVTDPDYTGSATIPFTAPEVGGGPSTPTPTSVPTTTATSAAPAIPTAAAPLPAAPSATRPAATPSPAATGSPSGSPNAAAPAGVVPALPTVPPVPASKDASGATSTFTREKCADFSGDPALWQALEDHLDELDEEETPITAVKTCLGHYRSQPWPSTKGGATLVKPDEEQAPKDEPPPKATLQTLPGFVLKAGEQGRTTVVPGAVLGKGDIVSTRNDPTTVSFSEGTRVELGPKSAIVIGDPAEKAIIQLRGRMFMDVKSRQWHVRIPQPRGLVSVVTRGTVLTTEARDDGMVSIEVTEGNVDVTSGGQTVTVVAGFSIVVDPAAAPPKPQASRGAGKSGGQPVAVYGIAAVIAVVVAATGVFFLRRRGSSRT